MSGSVRSIGAWLLAAALLAPAGAAAQSQRNLRFSLMGGVGGSLDQNQAGLGNTSFQLGLSSEISQGTMLRLRVGGISYDDTDRIGRLRDPSIEYVTAGGEYQVDEPTYTSGIFFALGAYRVDGVVGGVRSDETVAGASFGATGDFRFSNRFSFVGEIGLHLLDSVVAQGFLTAHFGLALHL